MSLDRYKLLLTFLVSLIFFFFFPIFFPKIRLFYFAPFLVIACYQLSLPACLILAIGVGIIYDFFSPEARFGGHSIVFSVAVFLVFQQKLRFFKDNLTTLPFMTTFLGFVSSSLIVIFYEKDLFKEMSLSWIFQEIIFMSTLDGLYALVVFTLPPLFLSGFPKRGSEYFH